MKVTFEASESLCCRIFRLKVQCSIDFGLGLKQRSVSISWKQKALQTMHGILSEQRAAPQSMPLAGGATDSAIDAYAGRVLASRSPPETCVEPSLAPYVTSVLRASSFVTAASSGTASSSFPSEDDYANLATDIEEYDSLMELLQEHCGMDEAVARSAIRSIAAAVRTGTVDPFGEEIGTRSIHGGFLDFLISRVS